MAGQLARAVARFIDRCPYAQSAHDQIVREMKADGLVETLPWAQPPTVSSAERARLAEKLSHGKPLSEVIIEEREERA
jgi:hypothetical protein